MTWIRNTILRAIRDGTKLETRKISTNFVYQNPTVKTLSAFIVFFVLGVGITTSEETKINEMKSMVAEYTKDIRSHTPSELIPSSQAVLLTGSTGGIGCSILTHLANDPNVSRIYAVNRSAPSGISLVERQIVALNDRGYDAAILDMGKIVLIEGDLSCSDFGLSSDIYNQVGKVITKACSLPANILNTQLRCSVTHIIHNGKCRRDFRQRN